VLAWAGLFSVTVGAAIAQLAGRIPAHAAMIETSAGALLIGGLALIGFALPSVF
jgi:hypothetical protein